MENDTNRTKPAFRSSMSGYNKQDVNNYIAGLVEYIESERTELKAQVDSLNSELEHRQSALGAVESCKNEIAELNTKLEQANAIIAEQRSHLDSAQTAMTDLQNKLAEKDRSIAELNEKLSSYSQVEEKLKNYDRMTSRVGELMLEATASADKIKSDAQQMVDEKIRAYAEREKALRTRETELSADLERRYTAAVAAVNGKLNELAASGMGELMAAIHATDAELTALIERRAAATRAAIFRTAEKLPEVQELAAVKPYQDNPSAPIGEVMENVMKDKNTDTVDSDAVAVDSGSSEAVEAVIESLPDSDAVAENA